LPLPRTKMRVLMIGDSRKGRSTSLPEPTILLIVICLVFQFVLLCHAPSLRSASTEQLSKAIIIAHIIQVPPTQGRTR
jgi:hypothetical protein